MWATALCTGTKASAPMQVIIIGPWDSVCTSLSEHRATKPWVGIGNCHIEECASGAHIDREDSADN